MTDFSPDTPTLREIRAAQAAIEGTVLRTPLVRSVLAERTGHDVRLKLETLQPTGAFKLRGATYAIAKLSRAQRERGVVCCSTGNHGRAVAYAAKKNGTKAVVCLSGLVPDVKVAAIEALGAEVRRIGMSQDEAEIEVRRLVDEKGMIDIPPFDHPDVIAGQGTIGVEILEDWPDVASIMVPLSGGGLLGGIAIAAKAINPDVRIVGVAMERGSAMAASLDAGRIVGVDEQPTLADALGGGLGENHYTFALCRQLIDELVLVSEEEIYAGMATLLLDERIVAEGSSAVCHAAILSGKYVVAGPTTIVVSGRNLPTEQIRNVAAGEPIQVGDLRVNPPDE